MTPQRRSLLLRVAGSVGAAGAIVALFLLGRPPAPSGDPPGEAQSGQSDPGRTIALLGQGIDSVLSTFGIPAGSIRKRSWEVEGEAFVRTEWMVPLPDTIPPVSVNAAMNAMARRLGGRAVAAEQPRFSTVTVHFEIGGIVVHTVILRSVRAGKPRDVRQLRPAT